VDGTKRRRNIADWKNANIIPIFKKGSKNVATNYRPVSLTSHLCKVFEKIVRDQVVEFLEVNGLKDSQHGFRKGSSCLTNTPLFLDKVTRSVDQGHDVDIVFLDLAKHSTRCHTQNYWKNYKN